MNIMDIKHLFSHNLNLLLPKSTQIIKNLGKRKPLPTITPRERSLIIKKPKAFKSSYIEYINNGEFSFKTKEHEINKLKELFERSLSEKSRVPRIPSIKKTPSRLKKRSEKSEKIEEKIMITTFKRFKGSKLNLGRVKTRERDKNSEACDLLSITSKKSVGTGNGKAGKVFSESDEDKIEFDENLRYF